MLTLKLSLTDRSVDDSYFVLGFVFKPYLLVLYCFYLKVGCCSRITNNILLSLSSRIGRFMRNTTFGLAFTDVLVSCFCRFPADSFLQLFCHFKLAVRVA